MCCHVGLIVTRSSDQLNCHPKGLAYEKTLLREISMGHVPTNYVHWQKPSWETSTADSDVIDITAKQNGHYHEFNSTPAERKHREPDSQVQDCITSHRHS